MRRWKHCVWKCVALQQLSWLWPYATITLNHPQEATLPQHLKGSVLPITHLVPSGSSYLQTDEGDSVRVWNVTSISIWLCVSWAFLNAAECFQRDAKDRTGARHRWKHDSCLCEPGETDWMWRATTQCFHVACLNSYSPKNMQSSAVSFELVTFFCVFIWMLRCISAKYKALKSFCLPFVVHVSHMGYSDSLNMLFISVHVRSFNMVKVTASHDVMHSGTRAIMYVGGVLCATEGHEWEYLSFVSPP